MRTLFTILAVGPLLACGGAKESEPGAAPPAAVAQANEQGQPAPGATAKADGVEHVHAAVAPGLELPAVPAFAKVSFVSPADGATVVGTLANGKVAVAVVMGAEGIAIKPAGPVEAGSGHHHVLIDTEPLAAGVVVPKDEQHVHFGQGQATATLELAPGSHTLMLQLADGIHRSYGPQLSATIKLTVQAAGTVGAGSAPQAQQAPGAVAAPQK